jgi:hypothetical protein
LLAPVVVSVHEVDVLVAVPVGLRLVQFVSVRLFLKATRQVRPRVLVQVSRADTLTLEMFIMALLKAPVA